MSIFNTKFNQNHSNSYKLGDLVSLLSGRDFENRIYKEEIAEESFNLLKVGLLNFINKYNYESFVLTIKSLGFISNRLLNSMMTLDFAYNLFLLLNSSNEISKIEIKRYVQKWFLLSTLTSRYISNMHITILINDNKHIK